MKRKLIIHSQNDKHKNEEESSGDKTQNDKKEEINEKNEEETKETRKDELNSLTAIARIKL